MVPVEEPALDLHFTEVVDRSSKHHSGGDIIPGKSAVIYDKTTCAVNRAAARVRRVSGQRAAADGHDAGIIYRAALIRPVPGDRAALDLEDAVVDNGSAVALVIAARNDAAGHGEGVPLHRIGVGDRGLMGGSWLAVRHGQGSGRAYRDDVSIVRRLRQTAVQDMSVQVQRERCHAPEAPDLDRLVPASRRDITVQYDLNRENLVRSCESILQLPPRVDMHL